MLSQRLLFVNVAKEMLKIGDKERAVEMLDMCQECVPEANFPLDITYMGFSNEYMVADMIETYYKADQPEKALELAERFSDQLFDSLYFFLQYYDFAKREFESCYNNLQYIAELAEHYGHKELSDSINGRFESLMETAE